MTSTLQAVIDAGQDFEWYPTTDRMIAAVKRRLSTSVRSIMDIGAGDGRVLVALGAKSDRDPELFAIEKSPILMQAQPVGITPVGVDFYEQNLLTLPVEVIFCNPPYSDYETWVVQIIETGYAERAFLVIPRRWKDSKAIARAVEKRGAKTKVIHSDDFEDAERRARAVVDIVEVTFPKDGDYYGAKPLDPFDQWFDEHVSTFDVEKPIDEDDAGVDLARVRGLRSIPELVEAFNEDHGRMEANYRAIFALDHALLKELGVSKDAVRSGIKKRMAGLKAQYWQLLFEKLDALTSRLSTATKARFLDKLTRRTTVAFTADNAYAIVLWAIKHANLYYDEQLVDLFKALSTFEGVSNYASNRRTWEKFGWRHRADEHSHYALDYRIVVQKFRAIYQADAFGGYDYQGNLHTDCHELLDDVVAVMGNLGFTLVAHDEPCAGASSGRSCAGCYPRSRARQWRSGAWQDFHLAKDESVLFQVKAHQNGNLHFRFLPEAIRALNVEAGRLLGWLHGPGDVEQELGYSADEARASFGSNHRMTASTVRRLMAAESVEVSA